MPLGTDSKHFFSEVDRQGTSWTFWCAAEVSCRGCDLRLTIWRWPPTMISQYIERKPVLEWVSQHQRQTGLKTQGLLIQAIKSSACHCSTYWVDRKILALRHFIGIPLVQVIARYSFSLSGSIIFTELMMKVVSWPKECRNLKAWYIAWIKAHWYYIRVIGKDPVRNTWVYLGRCVWFSAAYSTCREFFRYALLSSFSLQIANIASEHHRKII